jgi:hypothetical protein
MGIWDQRKRRPTYSPLPEDTLDANYFKTNYDNKYKTVRDHTGKRQVFSAEKIIEEMMSVGISLYDAIDILKEISPVFRRDISTKVIHRAIYQSLVKRNSSSSETFLWGTKKAITIIGEGRVEYDLSFNVLRNLVLDALAYQGWEHSKKTLKFVTNELFRITRSFRAFKIKEAVIQNLIPLIFRQVIGFNPFDVDHVQSCPIAKQYFEDTSTKNDSHEEIVEKLTEAYFDVCRSILVPFRYLPGPNIHNTSAMLLKLAKDKLNEEKYVTLDERLLYISGQVSNLFAKITEKPEIIEEHRDNVEELIQELITYSERINSEYRLRAIHILHYSGAELFSWHDSSESQTNILFGAAMTGIQSLLQEISSGGKTKVIEQENSVTLITSLESFYVIFVADARNSGLISKHGKITRFIEKSLGAEINKFNGVTTDLNLKLQPIISEFLTQIGIKPSF